MHISNDMLAFTIFLRFREPRLVFTPRGAQKSEGEKGSPANQCRFAWHKCVCLLTMWGHNMKSKQPGFGHVWPRKFLEILWEVLGKVRFSPAAISKPVASVAPCVSQALHKLHSPCWATEHSWPLRQDETRIDKVCGLRSLASLPITGRRWTSDPNGSKFSKCCVPIPCLSHALSTYSTFWTPKTDTFFVPISPSSFSFSHLATATSHWTPGPDNDLGFTWLHCATHNATATRSGWDWTNSPATQKYMQIYADQGLLMWCWGSSHSCRHPGSPKCPRECPGMNAPMVGNGR